MLVNLNTFITDFKASGIVDQLNKQHEVILIWLTGSHAMSLSDGDSDYDLGVLIADNVDISKTEKNPITYKYKKNNKEVQCIYNNINDIFAPMSPEFLVVYQYLCWCVFIDFQEEHLIYVNPKYQEFVENLIAHKIDISINAFHSFVLFFEKSINLITSKEDIKKVAWGKMLTYLCWYSDRLRGVDSNTERLLRVKRTHRDKYSESDLNYIFDCLSYIREYLTTSQRPQISLSSLS